jgi:L-amino acid N-acyltransferase
MGGPEPVLPKDFLVRLATRGDVQAINDIYNHYVPDSTCTYQEEPEPLALRQQWFANHGHEHPVTVAQLDGRVVGWGSLSPYHLRSGYRHTVENSVYVHPDYRQRGIGSLLLADLIARAREIGHRAIVAAIDSEQGPSLALHAKHGFKKSGHLSQVGFKCGRWLDVIYLELLLT